MTFRNLPLSAFLVATVVATVLGSVAQTQFNLAAITALGVDVPLPVRLRTTVQDLLGFGRTMAPIAAATLLLSLPVATWIARRLQRGRVVLCALGAAIGFCAAIAVANRVAGMPALIAATRGTAGMATMAATLAIAGAVFGGWSAGRRQRVVSRPANEC